MSSSFSSELVRRRVLQSLGLYLAGAWIAVEFSNWAEERYLLSPYLADVILLGLLCMLPAWIMFAWFHGAPGKDQWHRAEKVGIPLNIGLTFWVLWTAFGGKDLSAAAQAVTVTDELGTTQQIIVPSESHQQTVGVFFWDFTGNQDEQAWLQYGFPLMLATDLDQDPFVRVLLPYSEFARGIYRELDRAGYISATNVPVSLMARVAVNYSMDYFIAGSFSETPAGYDLTAELYQVGPTRSVAVFQMTGDNAMSLMDELSVSVSEALEVPDISGALADDLEIRDHMTHSLEAMEQAVLGANAKLIDNDYPKAIDAWQRALEIDPAFALVARHLGLAYFLSGNTEAATAALQKALQHDYRLSETDRYVVKGLDYFMRGELEKRERLFEMWVKLSPNSPDAHLALADVYVFSGDRFEDAVVELRRAAELMPNEARIYQGIGSVQMLAGDRESAIENFQRYVDLRPDDPDGLEQIGMVYERQGDLERAFEYFERTSLVADERVDAFAALARLATKQGDYEKAEQLLQQGRDRATTPQDMAKLSLPALAMYERRGQLHKRLEASIELVRLTEQFRSPLEIILGYQQPMTKSLAQVGRVEEALQRLDQNKLEVGPPLDQLLSFSYAEIYLLMDDLDAAEEQIALAWQAVEQMKQTQLAFILTGYEAEIAHMRGDFALAAEKFAAAAQAYENGLAASSIPGGEADYIANQARNLRLAGDWFGWQSALDDILAIDPANPLAHLELAYGYIDKQDLPAARKALGVVANAWALADPEFPRVAEFNALVAEIGFE